MAKKIYRYAEDMPKRKTKIYRMALYRATVMGALFPKATKPRHSLVIDRRQVATMHKHEAEVFVFNMSCDANDAERLGKYLLRFAAWRRKVKLNEK